MVAVEPVTMLTIFTMRKYRTVPHPTRDQHRQLVGPTVDATDAAHVVGIGDGTKVGGIHVATTPNQLRMAPSPVPHILVVDDEEPILELITGYLEREGFRVSAAMDGEEAVEAVRERLPDVIILDVMLPGLDGIEVCRQVRTFSQAYILMLTARGEEIDRIMGLTVGADAYLTKPFSPRELTARVKALLRRGRPAEARGPGSTRCPDGLQIDLARRQVRVDGGEIDVTALEFNLLTALAAAPGVVVTRPQLLDRVWGHAYAAADHLVDVHVANLRRKLGDDPASPRFVETVRSVGYRLREGPA